MSILPSMSSGISGGATKSDEPIQTQENTTPSNPLNVADEVANITSQNSLAMRSAKAKGNQIAASRNMQNSTLGAEAAQRAMVDAALPMAQQNVGIQHDIKMQEDSVRANTVGEYLNAARELQTSFFDAYKDIQSAEIPAAEKAKAIEDLYVKQQQQLEQMKQLYGGLATTEQDWSDFADLLDYQPPEEPDTEVVA